MKLGAAENIMGQLVYVAKPQMVQYGRQGEVYMGQVFETENAPNDGLLLAPHIGYLKVVEEENADGLDTCVCGRVFLNGHFKQNHMREMDHAAINLDAPIRTGRQRGQDGRYISVDPDGDGRHPLEPEGAPTAPPISMGAGVAGDRGSKQIREGHGAREVFRLGGGPPEGVR